MRERAEEWVSGRSRTSARSNAHIICTLCTQKLYQRYYHHSRGVWDRGFVWYFRFGCLAVAVVVVAVAWFNVAECDSYEPHIIQCMHTCDRERGSKSGKVALVSASERESEKGSFVYWAYGFCCMAVCWCFCCCWFHRRCSYCCYCRCRCQCCCCFFFIRSASFLSLSLHS